MRTGVEALDRSLLQTQQWVAAVDARMNARHPRLSMTVLQSTLQALREQLDPAQAARFADQLPLPLKGAFFEGWRPGAMHPAADREAFLARIEATSFRRIGLSLERAVKAALEVIAGQLPAADVAVIVAALPEDLTTLRPESAPPWPDHRRTPPAP